MIAMECEEHRIIQEKVDKIVGPIFEKVLVEKQREENYPLRWWV